MSWVPSARALFPGYRPVVTMLAASLLSAIIFVQQPSRASAEWVWCWNDPIVEINGARVSIAIGVLGDPEVVRRNIRDATLVISVPEGVKARKIRKNEAFFDYEVEIEKLPDVWHAGESFEVVVAVQFTSTAHMPALLRISHGGTLIGSGAGSTESGVATQFAFR